MVKYECHICGDDVGGKSSAMMHIRVEHRGSDIDFEILECPWCGIEFYASAANAEDRRFCSSTCQGEWVSEYRSDKDSPRWKGGQVEYGDNWVKARRRALERDEFYCQICGLQKGESHIRIEVHHIVPVRLFDQPEEANRLSNLVALCSRCHGKWEGMPVLPVTDYRPEVRA